MTRHPRVAAGLRRAFPCLQSLFHGAGCHVSLQCPSLRRSHSTITWGKLRIATQCQNQKEEKIIAA